MKKKVVPIFKCLRRMFRIVCEMCNALRLRLMLFINNVEYKSIHCNGLSYFWGI